MKENVNFELRKVIDIKWYCLGCGQIEEKPIYGLFHVDTDGLAMITGDLRKNYLCKGCMKK